MIRMRFARVDDRTVAGLDDGRRHRGEDSAHRDWWKRQGEARNKIYFQLARLSGRPASVFFQPPVPVRCEAQAAPL